MLGKFNKSNNPLIGEKALERHGRMPEDYSTTSMSVNGAVNKSLIMGCILLFTGIIGFSVYSPVLFYGGMLGALALSIFTFMKPHYAPITAPAFAALEGLFVGAITARYMYMAGMEGIVFQAVSLTIAILFGMLFIYKAGIIEVTPKFRSVVSIAFFGIFILYALTFVLSLFGVNVPFVHQGGMIGIGISLVVIGVASLNLLLDFDNFDKGEENGLPKYYEWVFAMGLIITLVWIYIELLRLLAILNRD